MLLALSILPLQVLLQPRRKLTFSSFRFLILSRLQTLAEAASVQLGEATLDVGIAVSSYDNWCFWGRITLSDTQFAIGGFVLLVEDIVINLLVRILLGSPL